MSKNHVLGTGIFVVAISVLLIFVARTQTVEIVVLHTNDHHGFNWPVDGKGGMAKQSTIINRVREKYPNVLILSAGDIHSGYPESDIQKGIPTLMAMGHMGFDAVAIGNHEFDLGISWLRNQVELGVGDRYVSANVYRDGKRMFKPYIIREFERARIAIIGLTTEETPYVTIGSEGAEFKNVREEFKLLLPELQKEAHVIIALTHLGIGIRQQYSVETTTDEELAEEFGEIDFIIGGHSHTLLRKPLVVNGVPIMQALDKAKHMGELHIFVNRRTRKLKGYTYIMHDLDESVPEDPKMVDLLRPYKEQAEKLFDVPVGQSEVELVGERELVRSGETNLGNLVTDLFRQITQADIAVKNSGGIRATIPEGEVTSRHIQTTFPFRNRIVTIVITGKVLRDMLSRSASVPRPAGAFLQVSGVKFKIKDGKAEDIQINGEALDDDRSYKLATDNFLAQGGDGYVMLKGLKSYDTGILITQVLRDHFTAHKKVTAHVEGRIKISPLQ